MRIGILIIWLLFGLGIYSLAKAQEFQDLESWNGLTIEYKHNKNWNAALGTQVRFDQNIQRYKQTHIEPEINHRLNKYIQAGISYRFIFRNKYNPDAHRFSGYLSARKVWKPWRVIYRAKYQMQWDRWNFNPEYYLRHRLGIRFQRKKIPISPGFSVETFHPFHASENMMDQLRLQVSNSFKLHKKVDFKIRYIYSLRWGSEQVSYRSIIGTGLSISF